MSETREKAAAMHEATDIAYICEVCDKPITPDDVCALDVEMGACHAACLDGCPAVNLETGEPTEHPIPAFRFGDFYDA